MMQASLHPTPQARRVLAEQVRAVALALRWPFIVASALLGAATVLLTIGLLGADAPIDFRPELSMLPGMVGLLLPIAVWHGEARFGASLLWTLPVDRRWHALAKVGAGWVWLMALVALFVIWLLALTLLSGGTVLAEEMLRVLPAALAPVGLPPAAGSLDPAALQTVRWAPTPLLWLVPFTGATGAYVLASAVPLGVRQPVRWIAGTLLVLFFIFTAGDLTKAAWVARALAGIEPLYFGRYGFDALLTARTESLKTIATLSTGETVSVWRGVPDLGHWAIATLLWTSAGLIALWAAASRHRERR
jgi:hypothetical protein